MKRLKLIIIMLLSVLVLIGCGKDTEYSISFETNFDREIDSVVIEKGQTIPSLPKLNREGYDFKGWFADENLEKPFTEETISKNITLYAKWEVKEFTVTFMDKDTELESVTVKYKEAAVAPTVPKKDGLVFSGWDKDFSEVTNDLVVNALWDTKQFSVVFKDHEGNVIETVTVDYGLDAKAPQAPAKEGLVFSKWDKAFTNVKEDLEITAVYEAATYTVVFQVDGKQIGEEQIITHNESAIAPDTPEAPGKTFIKWDKDFTKVTSDLVINAVWEVKTYSVVFKDDEGNIIDTVETKHGANAKAPQAPTKEGLVFSKWDKAFTNVTEDLEINAIYEIATYGVIFLVDGKQVGSTQTITHNESATAPEDPEVPGKTFVEWDQDFTKVTSDLIINAVFDLTKYNIKYYDGNDELTHSPNTYTVEDKITLTDYELEGYLFLGWFDNEELTGEKVTTIDVQTMAEIKLYAKFIDSKTTYTLDYELNGGSWGWSVASEVKLAGGISKYSNLADMFTLDFYHYLKSNDLLTSPLVDESIHQVTWEGFSGPNPLHNSDPYAVYNDTTSNNAQQNNGYSQLFFDSATGDNETGEILSIEGGFLGTEPYKSKYWPLVQHIARLFHHHYSTDYQNTRIWDGASGKTLMGFVLDGYFYQTQGARGGVFEELRQTIPLPNLGYVVVNGKIEAVELDYEFNEYTPATDGLEIFLIAPSKEGYTFGGWFDNPELSGEAILKLVAGEQPPKKLYAKWISYE